MAAVAESWIPHRRADGEHVGWIRIDGDQCIPIDVLGRELPAHTDWVAAEEALEARGLAFLAGRWRLAGADGTHRIVLITEVSPAGIMVKDDDGGAIDVITEPQRLPFPAPDSLTPLQD